MDISDKNLNILVVGVGGIVSNAIKTAIETALSIDQQIALVKCMEYKTEDMDLDELNQLSSKITMQDLADRWQSLVELDTPNYNEPTINQLKKQIKYSKNPLEVKMLNKKLNQAYKDMKRR